MPIPGLSEALAIGRIGWAAVKGLWGFSQRNNRKLSAAEKLALRAKWKPQFANYLREHISKKLRTDVIIRDMRRIDKYPDIEEKKGISPWFRLGLCDIYERGIMVGMGWDAIVKEDEGYRHERWPGGEINSEKVILMGFIPFESIESVDWDGDGYYSFPHIYCYFEHRGEPYERTMFCRKQELDGWPYYTEVVDRKSVLKVGKLYGVKPR